MNYYEQVRDNVERLCECDTSDAQGIIGAWACKVTGTLDYAAEDRLMEQREAEGVTAEDLAREILKMPTPAAQ